MRYDTIKDAARAWVESFNAIPQGVIVKLMNADCEEVREITPPSKNDRVYIYDSRKCGGNYGEIVGIDEEDDGKFLVQIDSTNATISLGKDDFEIERDDILPMWGTMWAFSDSIDDAWLDGEYLGNGLQAMADCGFRIYEQEDYQYVFGIDGAGYDFYESHWIPLYKARGLHWHNDTEEVAE